MDRRAPGDAPEPARDPLPKWGAVAPALPEGMVLLDAAWQVVAADDSAGALLGLPHRRLAEGLTLAGLGLRDVDGTPFDHAHPSLAHVHDGRSTDEVRLRAGPATQPTWIDVRAVPLGSRGTGDPSVVLSLRDVSRSVSEAEARRQVQQRLRLQAQMLESVGQAVFAYDVHGTVIHWNRAAELLYGWSAAEVVGTDITRLASEVMSVDSPVERERQEALLAGRSWTGEVERRRRDGTPFAALVSVGPFRDERGRIAGIISVATDITARIAAERQSTTLAAQHAAVASVGELAISETDLHTVYQRSCDVVADVLDADVVSLLLREPAAGAEVEQLRLVAGTGFPDGIVGSHLVPVGSGSMAGFTLDHDSAVVVDDLAHEHRFDAPLLLLELGVVTGAATVLRAGSRSVGVLSAYRTTPSAFGPDAVNVLQSIGNVIARAIERDEARLTLSRLALTDQLTGLPNRALFQDRLHHLLAHRDRGLFAVLFIDLDDFKDVNDALGHDAGDEVLRVVGRRLREHCREVDTVARFGGDEFAVLCEDIAGVESAVELGERLIRLVGARPVAIGNRELRVGMSIGIAVAGDRSDATSLLRDADMAMYGAKSAGGSRVGVFDDQMRLSAIERLSLASDLRSSIDRGQLVVHYQPEIELTGDRIWAEAGWAPMSVSVNLSTWQLVDGDIVRLTADLLDQHGVDPGSLYFELTETALLREPDESLAALAALKELGVGLAIDDFGTGYSSLSYIRTLPVDAVKIDRSFVQGIGIDRRDDSIVDAIVALARSFGILTIAEGVETATQLDYLQGLGCDFAQGFLFAPPLPADDLETWLRGRS